MTKTSWFGFCGLNLYVHQHSLTQGKTLSKWELSRWVQTVFILQSFRPPNPVQDSFRASTLDYQVAAGTRPLQEP